MKPRAVGFTLRIYRALAAAFPQEFRNVYGEELVQVAEDAVEPIWRRHGTVGLIRLLLDIAMQIPAEYLSELRGDVRYGVRMLARSPGYTAVALVSLTLGIGVATSAFSEMNGFVLRDVPGVSDPGGLVLFERPVSYPDYRRYRERGDVLAGTLAFAAPVPFGVGLRGQTERVWGHIVTPSYFATLGVGAMLGRVFGEQDERLGETVPVVVSHRFWESHLGSDVSAVGSVLRVNGKPCTIVGVTPRDFQGAAPMSYIADLWLPVSAPPGVAAELTGNALEQHGKAIFRMMARLQPGVAVERAETELDTLARRIEQDAGDVDRTRKYRRVVLFPGGKLLPMRKGGLPFITGFFTLLGGMILLIAASNLANMTMARAVDRRKEIAVRLAMGASRARLVRQLLTECMLIASVAGVLGFVMAVWLMRMASQIQMPAAVPLTINLEPDGRVLLFTFALTVFTALAFGLAPALKATRADLTPALKEGGTVPLRRFRRLSRRNLLVVTQVAGSLALLLITGFLVMGHRRMMGSELGFNARNVSMVSLDPVRDGYTGPQTAAFFAKLLDRVRLLPSVESATLTDAVPMEMIGRPSASFSVGPRDAATIARARRFGVDREFFATLGIPIVRGRGFREEDQKSGATAVIVSERLARSCWPGQDPLGRRIEIGSTGVPSAPFKGGPQSDDASRLSGEIRVGMVVGVAGNIRDGVDVAVKELPPIIYLPLQAADLARPSVQGMTLVLRAKPGADVTAAVRREITAMDDRITVFHARTMQDLIDQMTSVVGAALWTYGCIGIFGLILAAVGLAGVTAYSVTQRRREIGIRMALGARQIDALGLVMKEGAVLVLVGCAIGFVAARAGTRMLAAIMADVARAAGMSDSDPRLLVGAPALLVILALVCCYVPARKSMRIDPVVTLRAE